MFDSVADTIERGERFAQLCSPAVILVGNGASPIPCKVSMIKFHEVLRGGGVSAVSSMHVRIRRVDANPALSFTRGQIVTVKRKVRAAKGSVPGWTEEVLELEVGDDNGSDSTTISVMLERPPV